jgi:ribosomal-protein-alanine N-acetyltransferase
MARKRQPLFRMMPASPSDLDEIMEIERLCFPSPWSRQVFVEEFNQEFSRIDVVRHDESRRMLAFINYWLVHDEVHVLNVATHPSWRRRGLARRLMDHAVQTGLARGARLVTLEVRRSNEAAQTLYERMGFKAVEVRPRYYENGEDAIVMILDLE